MKPLPSVIDLIGNTPMVWFETIGKGLKAKLFAKLELLNPTGSVKDRIAKYFDRLKAIKSIVSKHSLWIPK